jgi:hypothetical protein
MLSFLGQGNEKWGINVLNKRPWMNSEAFINQLLTVPNMLIARQAEK